ncbi:unnamed protein product [Rotaria socialis]
MYPITRDPLPLSPEWGTERLQWGTIGYNSFPNGDNDPKHTAGTISQWFVNNRIDKLKWPPQSPDLNPIEHIWDELERRLKPHSPKNKNELWNIMQKEWNGIGRELTSKLADSMPNRLQEVMKHHGGPTRY